MDEITLKVAEKIADNLSGDNIFQLAEEINGIFRDEITKLRSELEPPWTSENEHPTRNEAVWLCFEDAGKRWVSMCYVDDYGNWLRNGSDRLVRNPICWQEIREPEPPEAQE